MVDGKVATAVPGERLENLDLPDTVHGLTSSRLSRLSAIEQTTVKVASVLGVSFDADLLAAIHPLNLDERLIAEQLDDLARRDLIRPTETGFAFRHAVVQESAYEQLPLAMRRRLHEEVATRIEEAGPDPTQYPLLAHHWEAAGRLESALDYLEGAGAAALEAGAFDDAASFLGAALVRADQLDARGGDLPATRCAYIHQSLGEAMTGQGRLDPAVEQYQAALAKLGHGVSEGWVRGTARFIKEVFVQIGHLLGRRPNPGPQVAVTRQAAFILSLLGQVHYFQADVPRWLVTNLRSINLAERAGDPGVAGPAYAGLGNLVGTVRLHRLARRYFGLARADPIRPVFDGQPGPLAAKIERDVTTPFHVAADLSEAVYLLAGKADHSAEVIDLLDRTVDAAERIASDAYGAALAVRGFARTIYGPLDLARQDLSDLAADGHRRDQPQHETWARTLLVPLLVDAGDIDGAVRSSDAASLVVERADSIALGLHLTTRARALVAVGRSDEARAALAEADGALRPSPIFLHLTSYTAWCDSWATLAAGGESGALDELQSSLSGLRRYALLLPFARARVHLFKGRYALLRNRTAAARRHFRAGRRLCRRRRADLGFRPAPRRSGGTFSGRRRATHPPGTRCFRRDPTRDADRGGTRSGRRLTGAPLDDHGGRSLRLSHPRGTFLHVTATGGPMVSKGVRRRFGWTTAAIAVVAALLPASLAPAATGDPVLINEVLASHTGTDDTEYVELYGDPGLSLEGLSLIVVEGDSGACRDHRPPHRLPAIPDRG